ncbi:hypothetical protein NQ314_002991, partial [Rhamnusium bicolor]
DRLAHKELSQKLSERLSNLTSNDQQGERLPTQNNRQINVSNPPPPPPPPPLENGSTNGSTLPSSTESTPSTRSNTLKPNKTKPKAPPVPVKYSVLSYNQPPPCPTPDYDTLSISSSTSNNKPSQNINDSVEMESLDSFKINNPSDIKPKPPSTYFQKRQLSAQLSNGSTSSMNSLKKPRPVSVTIGEYPSMRRHPGRLDFLQNGTDIRSLFILHKIDDVTLKFENLLSSPQIKPQSNGSVRISLSNGLSKNFAKSTSDLTGDFDVGNRVMINVNQEKKTETPNGILKNSTGNMNTLPSPPSHKQVQKLLFSEYCDFEDMVLIESPFAQTTKDGKGIRQVHIGLTPSKLVLATDVLPPVEFGNFRYIPGIDPDIETFELIAIYPVDCVNLSIYRRRKRQALKARFCNNKVLYFELGGFEKRGSETSVATSTTGSTLYLLDKKLVAVNGVKQLWCKFGPNAVFNTNLIHDVIEPGKSILTSNSRTIPYFQEKGLHIGDSVHINRFASGVYEGCGTGLYLTADDYVIPRRYSRMLEINSTTSITSTINYDQLAENAVLTWEFYKATDPNKYKIRHKRRYGLAPQPLFLYGYGPWTVGTGAKYSVQMKRAVSEINIRRLPAECEMRLPVPKRQLLATVSCQCLNTQNDIRTNSIIQAPRKPVVYFWTPNYWYRPRSAKEAYEESQKHMKLIYEYQETQLKRKRRKYKRKFLRKFYNSPKEAKDTDEDSNEEPYYKKSRKRKSGFIYNMFGNRMEDISEIESTRKPQESSLQYLKRILRVDVTLTAWDFDSTTLAEQLTMIEKDLFLKISVEELDILIWQKNSKNAPNVSAIVAFSHRTSNLVATEVLKDDSDRVKLLSFLCRLYRDPRMPTYQKTFYIMSQNAPYLPYIGDIIVKLLNKIPEYKIQTLRRPMSRPPSFCNYILFCLKYEIISLNFKAV